MYERKIALVFTGDTFGDGGEFIADALRDEKIKASFFLTGNFFRDPSFKTVIQRLRKDHHYLGPHSDKHLLYCPWTNRDSLLITRTEFKKDLLSNYKSMENFGVRKKKAHFFLPPYEWYNDSIAAWTKSMGLQLINYSPGTISHADYTTPDMNNYRGSEEIMQSIKHSSDSLNGFILLLHIGTDSKRTDKLYNRLPELIQHLKSRGYEFVTVSQLLSK